MICKVCNKTKALMVSLVTALASNGQLQKKVTADLTFSQEDELIIQTYNIVS